MKTVNKILTYAASVMMVIAIVNALLLSALLMAEWIITKDAELLERWRKIAEEQCIQSIDLTTKNGNLEKEKTELIGKLADADRENHCLRKDLAEAKKREEIAHKTIEDQRKEVYDLQSTVSALEAQLESAQSQITTLKAKLSRKPRKPFPPQNIAPIKVEE